MKKIVEVKFDNTKQIYSYDANNLRVGKNDNVIARRDGLLAYGSIVNVSEREKSEDMPKIIRVANDSDRRKYNLNKKIERHAMELCKTKAKKYGLTMKLISVHLTFDATKIIFYFLAEKRIDFRKLAKDLAAVFRTKIEFKHIGVRDETKNVPAMGICGRPLCCNKFLSQFNTVSIKMAKNQGLSLNPMKVSGNCGRLLCCLKYEEELYDELNKNIPAVNSLVQTPDGTGKVMIANILMQTVKVALNNENGDGTIIKVYPLDKVQLLNNN